MPPCCILFRWKQANEGTRACSRTHVRGPDSCHNASSLHTPWLLAARRRRLPPLPPSRLRRAYVCNDFATLEALRGGVDPTQPNAVERISLLDMVEMQPHLVRAYLDSKVRAHVGVWAGGRV